MRTARWGLLAVVSSALLIAGCKGSKEPDAATSGHPDPGTLPPDHTWGEADELPFAVEYHVRPPGETYGIGDGSSWTDALSDLPAELERGARYYLASGTYYAGAAEAYDVYHRFADPEAGDEYIAVVKATATNHGSDDGWEEAFATGPAELGPIELVTGRYVIDGQVGSGQAGYGFHLTTTDCANEQAKVVRFPWDAESHHIILRHLDLEHCGDLPDTQPPHDVIYGNIPVSHVKLQSCYVHDANRTLFLMRGFDDVLIEDCHFARSGRLQEVSSINPGDSSNLTIRRNVFEDTEQTFISLRGVDNVRIYSNVFHSRLDDWQIYSAIENTGGAAAWHVYVYGNTFYDLQGLNTGIRLQDETDDIRVFNNLWAGCRTNQIMLTGEHDYNAFHDNWREEGASYLIDERIEEPNVQVLSEDPFVDAAAGDFHLAAPTAAGTVLPTPYDVDLDQNQRGADGVWDRGAHEYAASD